MLFRSKDLQDSDGRETFTGGKGWQRTHRAKDMKPLPMFSFDLRSLPSGQCAHEMTACEDVSFRIIEHTLVFVCARDRGRFPIDLNYVPRPLRWVTKVADRQLR